MTIYKADTIKELLSMPFLSKILPNIYDIKLDHLSTNGLSGSKMYKVLLISQEEEKTLFLKVNNLKEDWVAKISNDKGRELIIFNDYIYNKLDNFVKGVYVAYYQERDSYAILMNDMSKYIKDESNDDEYYVYLDNLARFHATFKEQDVFTYKYLLDVNEYYKFLTKTKVNENEDFVEMNEIGWSKIREFLGEELYNKYYNLKDIDNLFKHYPKTFLHGDYRPANTLYISESELKLIDWANSGCGPCTLDLFWYIITSVSPQADKTQLIDYYKICLEKYMGYKFTTQTWNTLLQVGILCACKMYLASLVGQADMKDKHQVINIDWWIDNLKNVLAS